MTLVDGIVNWQPFFGQNYSEQEITLTIVLILLISGDLTPYILLVLDKEDKKLSDTLADVLYREETNINEEQEIENEDDK